MPPDLDNSFGTENVTPAERQRRVWDLFNRVAPRYDLMNDAMSFGIHRWWKRRFVQGLPASGLCVDLAGGTGDVAALLARCPQRTVVVCDPSAAMMNTGRAAGRDGRILWVAGQAEQLPFADGSVTALTVAFGLRNVTHLEAALREAWRVLAPGGVFVCLEFSRPYAWFRPLYDAYSYLVIPRLGAWIAGQPDAYQYLVDSIRRFPAQQPFASLLVDAGFADVRYRNVSLGIACIHRGLKPD
ncbi:MAG: class I SAM-dependent methyltransferase [Gammaproteobacteria bacterium]|jgi:demethylmenaquinone methyltransferase/2-methoxy-6-polyprenyl-1,4-benzoquinol methylase|nr:class I SAM-dependent methyltransferase [Gammaproteobacteria bacterium]